MKKLLLFLVTSSFCYSQTQTPNIGLILPPPGSTNWNAPLNFNFNKLDAILGGVPVAGVTPPWTMAPTFGSGAPTTVCNANNEGQQYYDFNVSPFNIYVCHNGAYSLAGAPSGGGGGGGGGGVIGANKQVAFNNNGTMAGDPPFNYDINTGTLSANRFASVVSPSIGGVCYAGQMQTPPNTGNNGVANAMASCSSIRVDPSYTTDSTNLATNAFATRTPVGVFFDHGDYVTEYYRNPTTDSTGHPTSPNRFGINGFTGHMNKCDYDMSPTGSSGNVRISCHYFLMDDINPGWNYGAWQVTVPISIVHFSSSAGTQEGLFLSQHTHGVGDNATIYSYAYGQGGEVMSSAEGSKAMAWGTFEEANAFAGTITNASITPTNPTFITTTPNSTMMSQQNHYGLGTGRYLIPIGTCVSYPTNCPLAPFTGQFSSVTTGLDNVGSTITITPLTGGNITPSTVYGTINADINTPQAGANVQPPTFATPMTFNVTVEGGVNGTSSQYNTTELACFDSSYHECARPTAVSAPIAGVQQVTMPLRKLHKQSQTGGTSHLYQGGMAGWCLIPTAFTNSITNGQPLRYCFDVFGSRTITGTLSSVPTNTTGTVTYTGTNLTGMCVGGGWVQITGFTNSGNNGNYICSSSTATTLTVWNPNAVSESGASGTAIMQVLQAGTFGYSNVVAAALNTTVSYYFTLTVVSSSGTTVSANMDLLPNNGLRMYPGMSLYFFNTSGNAIDGQCNNVQFVGNSNSSFTCTNPTLSGTHSNTSTGVRGYVMSTGCSTCNNTTAGLPINSFALRPMAEVTDVRNSPTATQFSITSNVLTVQAAPNTLSTLPAGKQVFLSGFSVGKYLNNQTVTIISSTASQFTANFTHADVAATNDIGSIVPQPPAIDGSITLEPNVLGTLANGSYVEEVHHIAAQFQGHTESTVSYNPWTVLHDIQSGGVSGAGFSNGGYTSAAVHLIRFSNSNPDSMYWAAGGSLTPPGMDYRGGPHFSGFYYNHFPDGGATLGIQGAPNYQLNNPNFVAKVWDLQNRAGNTIWTDTPYSGDTQFSTNGNAVWTAASHALNGPVNNLTNDAGLISGMAVNYAPFSNQLSSWSGAGLGGAPITCNITDDLGNQACTLVGPTSGSWTLNDILTAGTYTPLIQGVPYTVQARLKGAVGGEQIAFGLNALVSAANNGNATVTLTTAWANYCVPFVTTRTAVTFGPGFTQSIPNQTIYVSNVVARPGYTCGPPILTTNNQYITPVAINKFPGVALSSQIIPIRAGSWTIASATSVAVTFVTPFPSTPLSCAITPTADPSAVFPLWMTGLSTTGMTVNVHTSGTISGTYQCDGGNTSLLRRRRQPTRGPVPPHQAPSHPASKPPAATQQKH